MSAPAAESPWYYGRVTGPNTFVSEQSDWHWLSSRLNAAVVLHNGAVCRLAEISASTSKDGQTQTATFNLETPHGVVNGTSDLYFAATSASERPAPPQPTGEDEFDYTYPPLPTGYDDNAAANGGATSDAVDTGAPYEYREPADDGSWDDVSCPRKLVVFVLLFAVMGATIVINSEISQAIGQSTSMTWLNVIWWVLLVSPIVSLIVFKLLYSCVTSIVDSPSDIRRTVEIILLITVWIYLFVIAVCTPYAWAHAQLATAQRLTMPQKIVSYNCFNGADNVTMSQTGTEFVFLEESQWELQQGQVSQKVAFTADDDSSPVLYYSYCVAPIVYKGIVPCTKNNLYAVCFRTTVGKGPCTAADAVACGWNLPPNGVVQRVMNKNEQFFQVAETTEDYDAFQAAFSRAAAGKTGNHIPVLYGGVSPTEIDDLEPGYELLTNQLRGVIYGIHFSLCFILALLYLCGIRTFFPCDADDCCEIFCCCD